MLSESTRKRLARGMGGSVGAHRTVGTSGSDQIVRMNDKRAPFFVHAFHLYSVFRGRDLPRRHSALNLDVQSGAEPPKPPAESPLHAFDCAASTPSQ
jgi:hypothetical protein